MHFAILNAVPKTMPTNSLQDLPSESEIGEADGPGGSPIDSSAEDEVSDGPTNLDDSATGNEALTIAPGSKKSDKPKACEWRNEAGALREFAEFSGLTQSALHIKPLHWYIACRLVIEGGFLPSDITPRPPLVVT